MPERYLKLLEEKLHSETSATIMTQKLVIPNAFANCQPLDTDSPMAGMFRNCPTS
jgi:hypothetical protein